MVIGDVIKKHMVIGNVRTNKTVIGSVRNRNIGDRQCLTQADGDR
jgi:hypothetical protein